MKLNPVGDIIILKLVPKEGSLVAIPETVDVSKDDATIFEVVAIGLGYYEGSTFVETTVKIGDRVFLVGYATTKLEHNGEQVYIGRIRDVLMTVVD